VCVLGWGHLYWVGPVLFVGGFSGPPLWVAFIYVCASKSNKMRNELISQLRCRLETKDILATATAIVPNGALWPLLCRFINGWMGVGMESLSLRPFKIRIANGR